MEGGNDYFLSVIFLGVAFLFLFLFSYLCTTRRNNAPGPYGFPLIGSIFQLGTSPHLAFWKMSRAYGGIFSIRLGCRNVIVLNSHDLVKEAFSVKACYFSGRPPLHSFQISNNGGKSIAFGDCGPVHRRNKKLAIRALHAVFSDVNRFNFLAQEESAHLCTVLTATTSKPVDLSPHLKTLVLNFAFRLVFGDTLKQEFTEELQSLTKKASDFIENNAAVNLIDFFPWFHFAFKRECELLKTSVKELMDFMRKVYARKWHSETREVGVNVAAMLDRIINQDINNERSKRIDSDRMKLDENPAVEILADIFGAGLETVSSSLAWAFLLILTKPGLQDELHAELGREIGGTGRLPTLQDRVRLPLLQATVLEVLRKASVLPLGIPHCTTQDTTVAGYNVPKGTVVLANLWAVNHDARFFHQPEFFNPYRFLSEDGNLRDKCCAFSLPFSAGGRRCMGGTLAKAEIFMFLACLLQHFRFELSTEDGAVNLDGQFGLTLKPHPFKVHLHSRVVSSLDNK